MKKIVILFALLAFGLVASASKVINKDTTIQKSENLRLEFSFSIFECGIQIYKEPSNFVLGNTEFMYSEISSAYKTVFTFVPKNDFVGSDTIVFLTGCSPSPDIRIFDTLRYFIKTKETGLVDNKNVIRLYSNPSNGQINIIGLSMESQMTYKLFDSSGKLCQDGFFNGDCIKTKVKDGIYILRISRKNVQVFEDKIRIKIQK
jgi:hypothetical protein